MKIGQRANQVLSKMKNFMEQWLWLAHWHLFHFGAKRGKPFKRITLYEFSLFWSGLFSFAEIFSGRILVSIDPKKNFISKKYLLLLSFLRSRFSSSSSALSSENPCSRSSRLCSMLEIYKWRKKIPQQKTVFWKWHVKTHLSNSKREKETNVCLVITCYPCPRLGEQSCHFWGCVNS